MKHSASSYKKGILTENLCCHFLSQYGYKIKHRRFKTKVGEIDIVACRNNELHMFEIKYRSESIEAAQLAIYKSYARMYNTYITYLYDMYPVLDPRFRYFVLSGSKIIVDDIDIEHQENT